LRKRVAGGGIVDRPIRAGRLAGIAETVKGFLIEAVPESSVKSLTDKKKGPKHNAQQMRCAVHGGFLMKVGQLRIFSLNNDQPFFNRLQENNMLNLHIALKSRTISRKRVDNGNPISASLSSSDGEISLSSPTLVWHKSSSTSNGFSSLNVLLIPPTNWFWS
jgi:hypothetical protein